MNNSILGAVEHSRTCLVGTGSWSSELARQETPWLMVVLRRSLNTTAHGACLHTIACLSYWCLCLLCGSSYPSHPVLTAAYSCRCMCPPLATQPQAHSSLSSHTCNQALRLAPAHQSNRTCRCKWLFLNQFDPDLEHL